MNDPTWDHYFIPRTEVLRNNFVDAAHPHGNTDLDALTTLDHDISLIKMAELLSQPTPSEATFDLAYMQSIHAHIFGEIYPFAGGLRKGPAPIRVMRETAPDVVDHAPGDPAAPMPENDYRSITNLETTAEHAYSLPAKFDYFRDAPRERVVGALAATWGAVNQQHVFREGNTRSQVVYFTQLAERAGYDLDFTRLAGGADLRADFVNARCHHLATGTVDRLAAVIDKAVRPITPERPVDRAPSINALLAATRTTGPAREPSATTLRTAAPSAVLEPGRDAGHDSGL